MVDPPSDSAGSRAIEPAPELLARLEGDPELAAAFAALTPGRRREYLFHIAGAKQEATRERRIDRSVPKILAGEGLREGSTARGPRPGDGPVLLSGGNPRIPKGDGPEPVRAYLAAMPGWKQGVGRHLDALIERAVPEVRRAVRWNSPFYGVAGGGWFASFHCFDRYVKVTFFDGRHLDPRPPVGSAHADARYAHIHEDEPIDVALFEGWVRQAAALPGWDGF